MSFFIINNNPPNIQNATIAALGDATKMKATNAVIGGEGNGGVIYPASHYGRD